LDGKTYKIRCPYIEGAVYVTINNDANGNPVELFSNTKHAESVAWLTAVTRLATMALNLGASPKAVATELKESFDPRGGFIGLNGDMTFSIVSEIGRLLERHAEEQGNAKEEGTQTSE
jgi:hypothetical protein